MGGWWLGGYSTSSKFKPPPKKVAPSDILVIFSFECSEKFRSLDLLHFIVKCTKFPGKFLAEMILETNLSAKAYTRYMLLKALPH